MKSSCSGHIDLGLGDLMGKYLMGCLMIVILLGCSDGEEGPSNPAPEFKTPDAEAPREMPRVYPSIDPCEVVQEYRVEGRIVRIPVWCDPEPFIYKGYPSPLRKP